MIHNIFWSHYKAVVFSELDKIIRKDFEWKVVQIALTEKSRIKLGEIDYSIHQYPYVILFNSTYEETTLLMRARAIIAEIDKFRPDVLVVPGYNDPAYIIAMVWAKIKGIALISTADSTEFDHPRSWYKEFAKRLILKLPDRFMCYGSRSKRYLNLLGISNEKIFIRVQATDNKLYRQWFKSFKENRDKNVESAKPHNFIFVGRLLKSKRVDAILDAYALCLERNPETKNWGVLVLGDGEEGVPLQQHARALGIADHIRFEGGVSWSKVPAYYAHANVFIFPSESETWGLVINEAMLCELPIIASELCGATPDLVEEGVTGFSFSPNNPRQLADLMMKFISKEVDSRSMGQAAFNKISYFSAETAAAQMLTAICGLKS